MRAVLAALPDGRWRCEDVLDSTGAAPDQQRPARIVVTVTIAGDEITFDFTGTDPQARGNVNAVEAVTVSAVAFALRTAIDPTIPANGGSLRPVHVVGPGGTLVSARPPAAVGAGNVEVSQRIADVCLGALAQAAPDRVGAAGQGTMNNVLIGGEGWVYYETIAGGEGGQPHRAGMSGVHTAMTNSKNTPIEALERAFPLRVLRYRLREGSGGAGRFRRRRRHRARPPGARALHAAASSPSAASASRRGWPAASRAPSARTGCCPAATSASPSASPTSAPSSSRRATSCGCSRRAAVAGARRAHRDHRRESRSQFVEGVWTGVREPVARTASSDEDGFWRLYADSLPHVYRFLLRRCDQHTAEDLTQELYVDLARRAGRGDDLETLTYGLADHHRAAAG